MLMTCDQKSQYIDRRGCGHPERQRRCVLPAQGVRREHTLTLDELSRRSGVSKGMLVEIEKGEANPSIAILCKVAAASGSRWRTS